MGRALRSEVVAFKCEPRTCNRVASLTPIPAPSTWHDEVTALQQLVDEGWGFVLSSQLRSYCPEHADRVWACSCRTNPQRTHLCAAHSSEAAEMVWDSVTIPADVETFISFTKGAHA